MTAGETPRTERADPRPEPGSAWSPFRHRTFLVIWSATVVSNVGTWMYTAASGWLMTGLDPDPLIVSLVQVAASLPVFLFALPAGALADIVDRRRFLMVAESATTAVSAIFAALVWLGLVTPVNLLVFTFLIGAFGALTAPAWQSIVPQLVPRQDLHAGGRRQQRRVQHQPRGRAGARRRHHGGARDRGAVLGQRRQQSRRHRGAVVVAFAAAGSGPSAGGAFRPALSAPASGTPATIRICARR